MNRRVGSLRWLLRQVFHDATVPIRGEAGIALWFRPAEYPSFLLGAGRVEGSIARDWSALLRPDDAIFDVGANIGFTVQRFYGLLKGRCRIWAFEPLPRNVALLERNTRKLRERVVVVASAVGDRDGKALFSDNRRHGSLSRLRELGAVKASVAAFWDDVQDIEVPMVTLDRFVATTGGAQPSFLKLDVEGAGHLVLKGAARVLEQFRPVVSCSYHTDDERHGVTGLLAQHGYRGVVRHGAAFAWCRPEESTGNFVHPRDARSTAFG
jgi:FkbM family methyltransferase